MGRFNTYFVLAVASIVCAGLASCSGMTPGTPDPPPEVKEAQVVNGNFEDGLDGWTLSGKQSAATVASDGCYGSKALRLSSDCGMEIRVWQKLSGINNGFYDLEFYAKDSEKSHTAYLEANGSRTALDWNSSSWKRFIVRGIEVRDGELEIGINLEAYGVSWCEFDALKLYKTESAPTFLKGGDISELTYVEQNGGKYSFADGTEASCLDILEDNGFNLVRLRLYNDPGNADYEPSRLMPAGIQDEQDILSLARRAKEKGMQILLSFHYSDYWTNGEDQNIPHEWVGMDLASLKTAVYEYTRDFLGRMGRQGTLPEYVSIGNEIQAGLLYPLGYCKKEDGSSNEADMCALFSAAAKGVREASPGSKIILHLNAAGDAGLYDWFLSLMQSRGVDYDIIGASYYPFWTNRDIETVSKWAADVTDKFGKGLIYMETGYAWNPTLPDGSRGQIQHNRPYDDMTREGQKKFLLSLSSAIKNTAGGRVLGYVYWDPVFIETPVKTGWIVGEKNCVSNSTLFDFSGRALESFDAYRYN